MLQIKSTSVALRAGVLFISLLMMLCVAMFVTQMAGFIFPAGSRVGLLCGSAIQGIVGFAGASYLYAHMTEPMPARWLGLECGYGLRQFLSMLCLFVSAVPFLNAVIDWNESVRLPGSMAGLERTLREFEENAAASSSVLLDTSTVSGLVSGIIVIGILTGLCEEIFFRGALQRTLQGENKSGVAVHASVWGAAFIFSVMHFQFFGFVPRLLLGALFGYMYAWSGSIWLPATAHALNNSLVVVTAWLSARGVDVSEIEHFGASENTFPWLVVIRASIIAALICCGRTLFFPDKTDISSGKES